MPSFQDAGINPDQEKQLLDWRVRYGHASGNARVLTDQELIEVGQAGAESYEQFSKDVWDTKTDNQLRAQMPWLGLGVASDFDAGRKAWTQLVNSYSDAWHSMTGEHLNPVFDPNGASKGHDDFAKIYDAITGNQSPEAFVTAHKDDPGFAAAHPWVAQGMNWDQYQVHRVTSAVTLADAFKKLTGQVATKEQIKGWQDQFLTPEALVQHVSADPTQQAAMPFLAHGLDFQGEQQRRLEAKPQMQADYFALTGQQAGDDMINKSLDQFQTPAQFAASLHTNQQVLDAHGWIKFGLDYQAFRSQKESFSAQFGHKVTDEEALNQLQNAHQFATGPTVGQAGAAPAKAGKPAGRADESSVR